MFDGLTCAYSVQNEVLRRRRARRRGVVLKAASSPTPLVRGQIRCVSTSASDCTGGEALFFIDCGFLKKHRKREKVERLYRYEREG